jgi:hypothetical protein
MESITYQFRSENSEVPSVQKIALATESRGIKGNKMREELVQSFTNYAINFILVKDSAGELPFALLPIYRDKLIEQLKSVIELHVGTIIKSNGDSVNSTIFDIQDNSKSFLRNQYIVELLATSLENIILLKQFITNPDKNALKLSTYYDKYVLNDFMSGISVTKKLIELGATDLEQKEFLASFGVSKRMIVAVVNIKSPLEAVETIYKNYNDLLSDTGITKKLIELGATDLEQKEFLASFGVSKRMRVAIHNIKSPLEAVESLFLKLK